MSGSERYDRGALWDSIPTSIAYAAAHYDRATGLLLMRHRWHDPALGRWVTRDPAGYVDGMSLYMYVAGNPWAYWDPMGQFLERCERDRMPGYYYDREMDMVYQIEHVYKTGHMGAGAPTYRYTERRYVPGATGSDFVPNADGSSYGTLKPEFTKSDAQKADNLSRAHREAVQEGTEAIAEEARGKVVTGGIAVVGGVAGVASQASRFADDGVGLAKGAGTATKRSLRDRMGKPPEGMKKPEAHHDLPQKHREYFEKRGIDIDDPAHGRWVEGGTAGNHQKWSKEFNNQWDAFIVKNPDATKNQVIEHMHAIRSNPDFQ